MRNSTSRANQRAIELRARMSQAEVILWSFLRRRQLAGARFRRQHPLGPYIVDFACIAARLVIEIDGPSHETDAANEHDRRRTRYLEAQGWQVVRYENESIYRHLPDVLEHIAGLILAGPPLPAAASPRRHFPR
jgi:very-short-patch-repair endonuclease